MSNLLSTGTSAGASSGTSAGASSGAFGDVPEYCSGNNAKVSPEQVFIGPQLQISDMEDIQDSFGDAVSIDHSERSIVSTPIMSRQEVSPTVPVIANDLNLKTSIYLAKAEVHSLSLYVAAAPESDLSVNNKRIRLNKRIGDIVLLKKAAKALQVEMEELTKADEPTVKIEDLKKSHVVPRNLPAFCWEGHNNIPGVHVFEDINTCIRNFMDVMNCYGLDLNSTYLRVIPACLSGTTRTWFEKYLSDFRCKGLGDPTWNNFAVAIQERYGLNAQEERNNCTRELNAIVMERNESLENFIDRFNSLRRRAVDQVLPESLLAEKFLCALPDVLSSQVSIASATLPEYKQLNLDILAGLARKLSNRFFKDKKSLPFLESAPRAPKRQITSINQDDEFHQSSRLSRHASATEANVPSSPTHTRPVMPIRQAKARTDKYCTFHRAHTHNTSECRAANENNNNLTEGVHASTDKKCYTCGVSGWSRSHICNTARRNDTIGDESPRDYHLGAMNFSPGRANNNYIADAVATAEYATSLGTSQSWENNSNSMITSNVSDPSLSNDTDMSDDDVVFGYDSLKNK